ncbi:hypothetical protein [Herbiconiux sp.]|uniref:hypothetical protein n=1 Tax=Herbiconiux sp. TaxID=1871186 RepID=UPI0025C25AD1|nr:hypothetical protein [Herbiconiux sp.]
MSGFPDFGKMGDDIIYEALAEAVAEEIRADGGDTADGVTLDLTTDDPGFRVDNERVRRRANQILSGRR